MIDSEGRKLRPIVGETYVDEQRYSGRFLIETTVVTDVIENDNELTIHYLITRNDCGDIHQHKSTRRRQKYLCVNGPQQGQRLIEEEVVDGYVVYNRSSRQDRLTRKQKQGQKQEYLKAILVYFGE